MKADDFLGQFQIGPNGAGKTTLLNCLSRPYQAGTGTIRFAAEPLLQLPRHRVARLGIGRTFQNLALFQTTSPIRPGEIVALPFVSVRSAGLGPLAPLSIL